jgi:regulator of sirC expression with transglutaminase-like and TPR domain
MHRLVILLPEDWEERRDRGLVLAELGRPDLGADDLALYLRHCPDAPDAEALRHQCDAWRRVPGARWL